MKNNKRILFPLYVFLDSTLIGKIFYVAIDTPQNCSSALPDSTFLTGTLPNNGQHTWTVRDSTNQQIIASGMNLYSNGQLCQSFNIINY
jgi:hypothetical protein